MLSFAQQVQSASEAQEVLRDNPSILVTYIPLGLTHAQMELREAIIQDRLHIKFRGVMHNYAETVLREQFGQDRAYIRDAIPLSLESLEIPNRSVMRMAGGTPFMPRNGGQPFSMNDFQDMSVQEFVMRGNDEEMIISERHRDYNHTTVCIYLEGPSLRNIGPDGVPYFDPNIGPVAQFHRGTAHPLAEDDETRAVEHYRAAYKPDERCASLHYGLVERLPLSI